MWFILRTKSKLDICLLQLLWKSLKFLKKPFENIKTVKFEDTNFNVPSDYHTNLIELYGDYMKLPPEEERIGHGKVYLSFGDDKDENKR